MQSETLDNTRQPSTPPVAQVPSDQMKGSFEGYMRSAPAYIQATGSGYDNPRNQQARYSKNTRTKNLTNITKASSLGKLNFNNQSNSVIMSNYSKQFKKDSSSQRLASMRKVERMLG